MKRNAEDSVDKKTGERSSPEFELEIVPPSDSSMDAIEQQRVELSERVKKQEIIGFLEIGPEANSQRATFNAIIAAIGKPKPKVDSTASTDSNDPSLCRFQTKPTNAGAIDFYRWSLIQITLITRFGLSEVDEKTQKAIFDQKPPVVMMGLTQRNEKKRRCSGRRRQSKGHRSGASRRRHDDADVHDGDGWINAASAKRTRRKDAKDIRSTAWFLATLSTDDGQVDWNDGRGTTHG